MIAYLGLGSNLGDRLANLQQAVNRLDLRAGVIMCVSQVVESAPMYVENQPSFLNAAAKLRTDFAPAKLLSLVKEIESECGRVSRDRNGPREADIDLLVMLDDHGALMRFKSDTLTLPHPKICERRFVIDPLTDIAPELMVCGDRPLSEFCNSSTLNAQLCEKFTDGILSIHSD